MRKQASEMGEQIYSTWALGLISLTLAVTLLQRIWCKAGGNKKHYKLPPGSTGWPLIGETISFFRGFNSSGQPLQFVQERERRYGQIFRSSLFGINRMVVSVDPEFNNHVLQNEGRLFQANYPRPLRNLMGKFGLLSVHGDLQKKLHGTAVNLMRFERLSVDFMEDIQSLVHTTFERWQAKGNIHLQQECQQLVLNLMAKQLLDLSPSKETEEICEAFVHFSAATLSVPIRTPGSSYARGIKSREFLIKRIYEAIKDRRQHPLSVHNDLLTKLLKEESFSEEVIADFILFLLFAGQETSSRSMSFAIKFLTDCPQALQALKAEHDALLKRKGNLSNKKITWDDYRSMKFTQCVINETLRLSSLPPGVFREAKEDITTKGGFVIPKGWTVYVLLIGTNLWDKYHSSPLTFNPWRWQQNLHNQDLSKNTLFMPFGGGARLCPGVHMAKLEIAIFLHNFVTKFRFLRTNNNRRLTSEKARSQVQNQRGVWMLLLAPGDKARAYIIYQDECQKVNENDNGIFIFQFKYANAILKRFNMKDCKSAPTPFVTRLKLSKDDKGGNIDPTLYKRLVGSLMYLPTTRQKDIL